MGAGLQRHLVVVYVNHLGTTSLESWEGTARFVGCDHRALQGIRVLARVKARFALP
jgi:hypothetical protein